MDERLTPRERIRKTTEFSHLYKHGRRSRQKPFHLVFLPNELGHSRLGCVTSRKVGNAVVRNKVRRWVRETFRRHKEVFRPPVDLLVVARPEIAELSFAEFAAAFLAAAEQALRRPAP